MNRGTRVDAGFVHGSDDERHDLLEQVQYQPVHYAVQRWEVEELIQRELPSHLQATALYAACDLTHDQSAILQGVTGRTVRSRLREIREILCPEFSFGAVVLAALQSCLDRPRQSRLPIAAD